MKKIALAVALMFAAACGPDVQSTIDDGTKDTVLVPAKNRGYPIGTSVIELTNDLGQPCITSKVMIEGKYPAYIAVFSAVTKDGVQYVAKNQCTNFKYVPGQSYDCLLIPAELCAAEASDNWMCTNVGLCEYSAVYP